MTSTTSGCSHPCCFFFKEGKRKSAGWCYSKTKVISHHQETAILFALFSHRVVCSCVRGFRVGRRSVKFNASIRTLMQLSLRVTWKALYLLTAVISRSPQNKLPSNQNNKQTTTNTAELTTMKCQSMIPFPSKVFHSVEVVVHHARHYKTIILYFTWIYS